MWKYDWNYIRYFIYLRTISIFTKSSVTLHTRHSSCLTHRSTAMSNTRLYPVRPTICDEGSIHPHWWIGMIIFLTMMAINWRHRQIHHFGTSSQSYYCDRWWHIQFPSTVYNITNLSFLFHGGGRIWLRPTFPLQSLQYTFLLITNSRYIFLCFPIPITDPDCIPIIEISLCLVIPAELSINIILIP